MIRPKRIAARDIASLLPPFIQYHVRSYHTTWRMEPPHPGMPPLVLLLIPTGTCLTVSWIRFATSFYWGPPRARAAGLDSIAVGFVDGGCCLAREGRTANAMKVKMGRRQFEDVDSKRT